MVESGVPYVPAFLRHETSHASADLESPPGLDLDYVLHPEDHVHRPPRTLHHEWHITSGLRRPDGVSKEVYLINDAFLGPTLECRSGDRLVVTVHNDLSDDGIAMHWHGMHMRGANDMDGAVGFTQDPVPPGMNYTYDFRVGEGQHGTFWYHAHDGVQRADGLFGALIVHRPAEGGESDLNRYGYDEERLLVMGDWYHRPAKKVLAWYMRAASFGNEPVPDSLLLNGMGAYDCAKAVPARPVDCVQYRPPSMSIDTSRRYRLRMINAGDLAGLSVKMTGLSLTAIQVDGGHEIDGHTASSVGILHPGQRADLIVQGNAASSEEPETLIELDRTNFKYPNPALTDKQHFTLSLTGGSPQQADAARSGKVLRFDLDTAQSKSDSSPQLPSNADLSLVLYSTSAKMAHLGNVPHGFLNHTSWAPQSTPPGHLLSLPREQWDAHQFIPQIPFSDTEEAKWVDIVLNNLDDGSHPFHLHGHDVWVLQTHAGFGWGSWNPFEAVEAPGGPLNIKDPVRRDTVMVPKRGYTVLRFRADNPGVWMFHCHILWHQASGMAMGFQVGGDAAIT